MRHQHFDSPTATSLLRNYLGHFSLVVVLFVLLLGSAGVYWSRSVLRPQQSLAQLDASSRPPLYLPSARKVKLITMGYNNFFSDVLWFNTLNYFGKQFDQGKDYRWLGHMCGLVTDLNNKARFAFEFCATMLSWIAQEPERSTQILNKAIESEPNYWRYWYVRGFNHWYFLERKDLALRDLHRAARLPNAPPFLASLASRLMIEKNDTSTAIHFLKELIENTEDETARKALGEKLKLAYMSDQIRVIRKLIQRYEQEHNAGVENLAQLVEAGYFKESPKDPFNHQYYLDPKTGEILSSSGKKGLEFFGKTAETGIARHMR